MGAQVNKDRPSEQGLKVPDGPFSFKEPKGDVPQLKWTLTAHSAMENLLNTSANKDSKLEKHFFMTKNFPNMVQTPPQTYKFKKLNKLQIG